jgi:RNA polymerase sigma factor (sigma-70 family)
MSNKLSLYTIEVQQDKRSEDLFWDEYYLKLQKYCYFLTQNKWDGDDLAQEAMVKAMTYYSQEQINSALLNKIAKNNWMDTLRKRNREKLGNEQISERNLSPVRDTICSVDLLMDHFTPRQAIILMLKEAFQYQSKEIAEILDTTEIAVKSSLNRAKKRTGNLDENISLDSYWAEEEREQLWKLFYDSLLNEDPTLLIESIPSIISTTEAPSALARKTVPFNALTPSSTLCMAA